jgi:dCMP deaminase
VTKDHWERRFYRLAQHVAQWSKDPITKVGAVLVGKDRRDIALGYNGFPPGVTDSQERLNNPELKYVYTQHAERNVLDNARFDTRGSTLYTTFAVCSTCAKSVVTKKVALVICPPWVEREPWNSDGHVARMILLEGGVAFVTPVNEDELT